MKELDYIIVGCVGAFLGGWLLGGYFLGMGIIGDLIIAFIGAVILIFILKLVLGSRGSGGGV